MEYTDGQAHREYSLDAKFKRAVCICKLIDCRFNNIYITDSQ